MNKKFQFNTKPDDYFENHEIGIESQLQHQDPANLEYERLCYEAFLATADGRKLLGEFKTRIHCAAFVDPSNPNADKLALYFEGFREAFRGLEMCAKSHQKRILEHK